MSYEFDEEYWAEEFGEYHTEEHDGNTIHVWTSKGTDPENGEEIIGERILDLNGHPSMTSIMEWEDGSSTSTTIRIGKNDEDTIIGTSYGG